MITLETKLANIRGVNPKFLPKFQKLGIITVRDILWHFPTRYEDFSKIYKVAELEAGQMATVQGTVKKVSMRRSWRRNMYITEAHIEDETGGVRAIWFNQPFMARVLKPGLPANLAGKVVFADEEICLSNPTYELLYGRQETKHTAGLIPVYPETKGLTSKGIRYLVKPLLKVLPPMQDFLPKEVLAKNDLPDLTSAVNLIHFPNELEEAERARRRFSFEDIFVLQLHNLKLRYELAKEKAPALAIETAELDKLIALLPFSLTDAQRRSLQECVDDLAKQRPMNRLLQGDVGSGKTVVAALAAVIASRSGKQTAFMAPTEVLARQHYKTLRKIFQNFDLGIGLLTSAEARAFYGKDLETEKKKTELLKEIEGGKISIVVGTHALIVSGPNKKPLMFKDLALAIVDEQHRFGVEQRAALVKQEKERGAETTVHFLSMSATPIPRTLSLALFGDLDLSIIDELPQGRKPIVTKIVAPANRQKSYDFIREEIKNGRQAFVIYPRIEASAEVAKGGSQQAKLWADVKAVKDGYEKLSKEIFKDLRVGMLHGKMKSKEKEQVMADFSSGKINILVSTSVVEVGVDVPNASIMVIESADRFGLSQLYQFRGRVGRAEHQSYCLLFTDSAAETTQQRLEALMKAKNGFELAEFDLKFRGPGQFLGDKQTGLPDFAMDALNNIELVKNARLSASDLIAKDPEFLKYPALRQKIDFFKKKVHLE